MHFKEWISLPKVIFFQRNNSLLHQRKVYRSLIHLRQLNHRIVWFFKFRISKNPRGLPLFSEAKIWVSGRVNNILWPSECSPDFALRRHSWTPSFVAANTYMLKLKLHSSHWDGDELSNWKKTSVLKSIATPTKKIFSNRKTTWQQQKKCSFTTFTNHVFCDSAASKPDSSANLRSNFLVDP